MFTLQFMTSSKLFRKARWLVNALLYSLSYYDYVDLLLSMKYLPNLIARHGIDRSRGMFSPNDGMITEPTKNNITRAENDDLVVHFQWLRNEENRRK